MTWVCKKHGKTCKSYVAGICRDINAGKLIWSKYVQLIKWERGGE